MAGTGEILRGAARPGEAGMPQPFVDALRFRLASFAAALLHLSLQGLKRGERAVGVDRALARTLRARRI